MTWVGRLLRREASPVRPELDKRLQVEVDRLRQITNELREVTHKLTAGSDDGA